MTDAVQPVPPRGQEVELKFRVTDPAAGDRLIAAGAFGDLVATGARPKTVQTEDRYVDTPDGDLARAGYAVRLRQIGDATIVSVKGLALTPAAGGAMRRLEVEGPADPIAIPADWPPSDARALVIEHAGDVPLAERVTLRQLRRKRVFKAGASRVELSLDAVDVVAHGRIAGSFVELEAELLKGDEGVLADLAARLEQEAGLERATMSKLEAALAAIDGEAAVVEPATGRRKRRRAAPVGLVAVPMAVHLTVGKTPGVLADDHIAEAGRKVLRFHLARMLDYEPGTRSGEDAEDLHKMRVATRRQRAAWRIFGEGFKEGRTKRSRDGLRDIARRLGAVRDLDVLLDAADAYRADLPTTEQRALQPLLDEWRARRDDARVLLLRELDSDGYRRWVDDYVDLVRTEGAAVQGVGPVQPHRVRNTAPSRIWAAYEGVRGYEPVLKWADVETLHDLRIAGKWLRYSLEFVREALGREADPLIARVTALQDHLGLMHDADVAASMARTFLVERGSDLSALESAAIGRFLMHHEKETARLRRTIGIPWRGVAGLRFRRALGRVVAGL